MRHSFLAELARDDPELYSMLWAQFAEAAGVNVKRLKSAYDRVVWDGNYGPVSDAEWVRVDGRKMPLRTALGILRDAIAHQPSVYVESEYEDEGEPTELDPQEVLEDFFHDLVEIYGDLSRI